MHELRGNGGDFQEPCEVEGCLENWRWRKLRPSTSEVIWCETSERDQVRLFVCVYAQLSRSVVACCWIPQFWRRVRKGLLMNSPPPSHWNVPIVVLNQGLELDKGMIKIWFILQREKPTESCEMIYKDDIISKSLYKQHRWWTPEVTMDTL